MCIHTNVWPVKQTSRASAHSFSLGGFVTKRGLMESLVWKRVVMRYADTNWNCLKSRVHISRLAPPSDEHSLLFFVSQEHNTLFKTLFVHLWFWCIDAVQQMERWKIDHKMMQVQFLRQALRLMTWGFINFKWSRTLYKDLHGLIFETSIEVNELGLHKPQMV